MYGREGELCPSFGKVRTPATRKKMSNAKKGKKYPKISEANRRRPRASQETREKQSLAHRTAIANGRPLSGFIKKQYIQGTYKGTCFRSSYEFAFMLMIESSGRQLSDLLYEHVRIPYEIDGKKRTYVTDFYDVKNKVVYEIKHSHDLSDPVVILKCRAAKVFCKNVGCEFVIVTQDVLREFLLTRKQIREHPFVTLCS